MSSLIAMFIIELVFYIIVMGILYLVARKILED